MGITPVGAAGTLLPLRPAAEHGVRTPEKDAAHRAASVGDSSRSDQTTQHKQDVDELKRLLSKTQLEVRFQVEPDSGVTITRIVDPLSGKVVREYPNAELSRVLADLRARAARHFDQKA